MSEMEKVSSGKERFPGYEKWWSDLAGHLGGAYPFYDCGSPDFFSLNIKEITERKRTRGEALRLDTVGLVTKSCLPHLLGDRTLFEGVSRAPWVVEPRGANSWITGNLPEHGREEPDPEDFVVRLKNALKREAAFYVKKVETVGILLSGGMDSRVVAGIMRELELDGQIKSVVALTWGSAKSRDVVYARQIAKSFGWDSLHFPITAETLNDNISIMGSMGAEVSPLHLHAMPDVARVKGIDVIIAGSYGDSVGRAEFSGRNVTELKPIIPWWLDKFGVVRSRVLVSALPAIKKDAHGSDHFSGVRDQLRCREIEQEMHYMRRMLQSCMLSMGTERPLFQMFTAPEVFGLMWSLSPKMRGDDWYYKLLQRLPGKLLEIPWARTGLTYKDNAGIPDDFHQRYHSYGRWLRQDLGARVKKSVKGDRIQSLGIFNKNALSDALKIWEKASTESTNSLDELMAWLTSVDDLMDIFGVTNVTESGEASVLDLLKVASGGMYSRLYLNARERIRD